MENREMPILHKASGLRPVYVPNGAKSFLFVPGTSRGKQKTFLCVLGVSAVTVSNFIHSLITLVQYVRNSLPVLPLCSEVQQKK
jgi:hypothetical protein